MTNDPAASSGEQGLALDVFHAAIRAAEPRAALRTALAGVERGSSPVHIIAGGKAAAPMAAEALDHLDAIGRRLGRAVVIVPHGAAREPDTRPEVVEGDHPTPGDGSLRAAEAIERVARGVGGDECWVLLSGGFSSLAAAPVTGVSMDALVSLFDQLLGSGLDIHAVNTMRKQVLRWGGGRLAAALHPALVRVFAISDVPGDREEDIGSGPCSPDGSTPAEIATLLAREVERKSLSVDVARWLGDRARSVETLKTGDPAFARVSFTIVARNADAVAGAQSRARELTGHGCATVALAGEARAAGRAIAEQLRNIPAPGWIIAGGETSVTLSEPRAPGGRCQELALAAAQELRGEHGVALLAAGTDGRDGTTDAAGAIVDGATWERIRTAGIDPAAALASHRANEALARADALVRTGPTGTNVMDLVVGVRL